MAHPERSTPTASDQFCDAVSRHLQRIERAAFEAARVAGAVALGVVVGSWIVGS